LPAELVALVGRNCHDRVDAAGNHKASRTLRVSRSPDAVWPAVMQATQASSTPVDVLESVPPQRLVTPRHGGREELRRHLDDRNRPGSPGVHGDDHRGRLGSPTRSSGSISRFVMGHHATLDGMLKKVAASLNEEALLAGE